MPIQKLLPGFLRRHLKQRRLRGMSPREVFEEIFQNNAWRGSESVSGTGSDREQTAAVAAKLPGLLRDLGAESLLDIPCGDFYWMRDVNLDGIAYTGADIVADLVETNQQHATPERSFVTCDLLSDPLPQADAVFCRDCLVHLSNEHVWQALRNLADSGARHVITTTFRERFNDRAIATGQWRPLNLEAAPFNLPRPLRYLDELCTQDGGKYPDKMLGVWTVEAIRGAVTQSAAA